MGTDLSTFSYHNAGESSVHSRPRCECGGIFDPHPTYDAADCRSCRRRITGEEHSRAMDAIIRGARQAEGGRVPTIESVAAMIASEPSRTHIAINPAHVDIALAAGLEVEIWTGPATSADLLELDAVPDPVDSDAPGALQPPGTALREYLDRDR